MNDKWDPNAYHGGPLRAGDFPLSQRADYKGDAYYARMFKWPRRIAYALFLMSVPLILTRCGPGSYVEASKVRIHDTLYERSIFYTFRIGSFGITTWESREVEDQP